MTYIEVSGSRKDLEEISLLSAEVLEREGIQAKTELLEYNLDSTEVEQILPILQIVFNGVIAVAQIVNTIINMKQKKTHFNNEDIPISVTVRASNGTELDMKISSHISNEDIDKYQSLIQKFVNDFLFTGKTSLISISSSKSIDIVKVNLLFKELINKISDIRKFQSLSSKESKQGNLIVEFVIINLTEAIKSNRRFYLLENDIKLCQTIFHILERENVLCFHEISTDLRIIYRDNIFLNYIGYEIEILPLFKNIIQDKDFTFYNDFKGEAQYNYTEQTNSSEKVASTSQSTIKTILILAANPRNTSWLRLDEEVREIEEGLRRANKREQFKLEQKWAVRLRDFYRAILDYQPHIVHFSGHGAGGDGIVLENETGLAECVQASVLSSMFKLFAARGVECVVLNACYSQMQAQAISQHVKYVIGMNQEIRDKAAVAFAVAFYDAIAAGENVEFAYELGCTQMMNYGENQTPVLLKNKKEIDDWQAFANFSNQSLETKQSVSSFTFLYPIVLDGRITQDEVNEILNLFLTRDTAILNKNTEEFLSTQLNMQEIQGGASKGYISCSKMTTTVLCIGTTKLNQMTPETTCAPESFLDWEDDVDYVVEVREDYERNNKYTHSGKIFYSLKKLTKVLKS